MRTDDHVAGSTSGEAHPREDAGGGAGLAGSFRLGRRQDGGPLTVFPVFLAERAEAGNDASPRYVTLRQALGDGSAEISEVSWLGSIPQLRVVNRGDAPILLIDGEELRGAKQNRILSTSVLVGQHSALVVPVTCSEKGRWAYATQTFTDSEVMAERRVRLAVRESVNQSVRRGEGVHADQGRVWDEIEALHGRQATRSGTSAMRDAYTGRKPELDRMIAAFPLVEEQRGVLVMHGQDVVGLDVVSDAPEFAGLHDRLLRSYAFEALVTGGEPGDSDVAEAFLERIAALRGERFESVGLGQDVRYEGRGVLGSALVHHGHVVHASFFDVEGARGAGTERSHSASFARQAAEGAEQTRRHDSALRRAHLDQEMRDRADADRARVLAGYIESLSRFELVTLDVPYGHMGATLADAVLQAAIGSEVVPPPRSRRLWQAHPAARTTSAFAVLLESSDPAALLGWSDEEQLKTLRGLTQLLEYEGVETEQDLLAWLDQPGAKARLTAIRGVGDRTFHYLRLLAGADDALTVDRWLWRILDKAGVRSYGVNDALGLYRDAAGHLGVSVATLEYSLWRHAVARRWRA